MNSESVQIENHLSKRKIDIPTMVAKSILSKHKMFFYNNSVHIYHSGWYKGYSKKDMLPELKTLMPEDELDKLSLREQKEVVEHIFARCEVAEKIPKYPELMNMKNGVYDVVNDMLLPHSAQYLFTYQFKIDYNPQATCEQFRTAVRQASMGDLLWERHLAECLGYAISDYPLKKEFILFHGESDSGKSLYINLPRHIVGNDKVGAVDMKSLNQEYYLAHLCSKRLNICSDLDSHNLCLTNLSQLKQLTSVDDATMVRSIRQSPEMVVDKPKMLFATNHYPKVISETENLQAYFNRVHIIPFEYVIPKREQIENLLEYLVEKEIEGIFLWIADGYRRFLRNDGNFTKCPAVKAAKRRYVNDYLIPYKFVKKRINFIPKEKAFTKDIEKALKQFIDEKDIEWKPEYMNKVRHILAQKGIENKKVRKGDVLLQGFYGIKLRKRKKSKQKNLKDLFR